jgi:hypothetical protein
MISATAEELLVLKKRWSDMFIMLKGVLGVGKRGMSLKIG